MPRGTPNPVEPEETVDESADTVVSKTDNIYIASSARRVRMRNIMRAMKSNGDGTSSSVMVGLGIVAVFHGGVTAKGHKCGIFPLTKDWCDANDITMKEGLKLIESKVAGYGSSYTKLDVGADIPDDSRTGAKHLAGVRAA